MGNQKKVERAKKNLSLPTPPLKKSALNFSPVEVEILLRQLDEQRHILTGRISNGTPLSASHIRQAWNKVAKEVSEVSSVARSGSDVRQKWIDLKQRTRQKLARNEKRGSGKAQVLSAVEEKVFSLIDVAQVLGIDGMEEGLIVDQVSDKVRVQIDKLKEGTIKSMQNRKSSTPMELDSTPPASVQDGSHSSSDDDDDSESGEAVIKTANGKSPKNATPPKQQLPPPTSAESPPTATKKTSPKKTSPSANSAVATNAQPPLKKDADSAAQPLAPPPPPPAPLLMAAAISSAIPPLVTAHAAAVTNGAVGPGRKRARMNEETSRETAETALVGTSAVPVDDGQRVKRTRQQQQQRVVRIKSQTVAQKLADTEARRLEMERSFAERRLHMDRELAETRLAVERELMERRLMFDLDMQERKLRIEQDFCSRVVGGLNRIVDGLLLACGSRQEQSVASQPARRNRAPKVVAEEPQVEVPPDETVVEETGAAVVDEPAAAVVDEPAAAVVDEPAAAVVDEPAASVVVEQPSAQQEEEAMDVSLAVQENPVDALVTDEVSAASTAADEVVADEMPVIPADEEPAATALVSVEEARDESESVDVVSLDNVPLVEDCKADPEEQVRRSSSPEVIEVVEEEQVPVDDMFIADIGIEEVTVETVEDEK